MSINPQVFGLTVSFDSYIRHGWKLVVIPPGTKGPRTTKWNREENCLTNSLQLPTGHGAGLAHAFSGTMALDIDNFDESVELLAAKGVNLKLLFDARDAVTINSGKAGHGKLLYAMPFGMTLPSKKITNESGSVVYELRCAALNGTTVQDVLPPSVHPETNQPYQWGGKGSWQQLPTIPIEILALWQELIDNDSVKNISGGEVNASWDEIRNALNCVPSSCSREEWVSIGMALQHAGVTTQQEAQAFYIWDDWSASSNEKYKGQNDLISQWKSFRPTNDGIKLGTLFHIATQHGYKRPPPDVSELFKGSPKSPEEILDFVRVPVPEFNMDTFPAVLRQRAQEISDSVGCDPIIPIFAGLSVVCGVCNAQSRLKLMEGFEVPPILWLMTIGDPAECKSPGSRPMFKILEDIEREDAPRFYDAMLRWEALDMMYTTSKANRLKAAGSTEQILMGDDLTNLPALAKESPPKPVDLRLVVKDITSQKLIRIVADRPEGVLCVLDEMRGWISKVTDKRSGEDRSTWTMAFEGDKTVVDRVGLESSIKANNFAVSIYGNIQPQVYKEAINDMATDGLLQRFIQGILRSSMTRLNQPIHPMFTNIPEWENTIRKIFALPRMTYELDNEAYLTYRDYQTWWHSNRLSEKVLETDTTYMQAYGKMTGLVGRMCLVFHLIENPYCPFVSKTTMDRAIDFVRCYVMPSMRYALSEIACNIESSITTWVIKHIAVLAGTCETVTLSELKRSGKRRIEGMHPIAATEAMRNAMDHLERGGWVVMIMDTAKRQEWAIYPKLADAMPSYRRAVIKANQAMADERVRIVRKAGHNTERILVRGYDPSMDDDEE